MEKEQEVEYRTKWGKMCWGEESTIWELQQKYLLATVGSLREGWEPCMFDGGCRKDIFSIQKEMLKPVGGNNAELHMLADCVNLRAVEKARETSGSLYLFREKPLEFNEVLQEWCRDFHNSQLNPGRMVWISGRDGIIFSYILKCLSSEAGKIRQTLSERQCSKKFNSCGHFQVDTVCAPLLCSSIQLMRLLKANIQYLDQVSASSIST